MEPSKQHRKGDVIKIGGDYRICVCADDITAIFFHCNSLGKALRYYDALAMHSVHGVSSIKFTHIKHKDATTLSHSINRP